MPVPVIQECLDQKLRHRNMAILTDTLDFETLSIHEFDGTIFSPLSAVVALANKQLDYYIWLAVRKTIDIWTPQKGDWKISQDELVLRAFEQLFQEVAITVADRVAGPHVCLVDPRNHANKEAMIENAKRLHRMCRNRGLRPLDITIGIPATEAGIRATQSLRKLGVHVYLYLVTSLMHAAVCAEARPASISLPVGPILSIYERKRKSAYQNLEAHPGVEMIKSILVYFKGNGIKTKLIGSRFRNLAEIGLFGELCDAVCVSALQADSLKWSRVPISILEDEDPAIFRARQAKYPTNLLTEEGGFSKWFSPESRTLTCGLLHEALTELRGHMDTIEDAVTKEFHRQFKLATLSLADLYATENMENGELTETREQVLARDEQNTIFVQVSSILFPSTEQNLEEIF